MHTSEITFVVLTKDEGAAIADCLKSIPKGSSIVVYDAESIDETREIAASHGATVVTAPWRGFVVARSAAASFVRTAWTFMLDADERISPALSSEIAMLDPADDVSGYSVPRQNMFCGRWIRSAGWWPDRLVRLFRTGQATLRARGGGVHERWMLGGPVCELHAPIIHLSYPSTIEYREKFARYTRLEAGGIRGSALRAAGAWFTVPLRFVWLYLGRRGIADGWQGAYVCGGTAVYPAVVELKAWRRSF